MQEIKTKNHLTYGEAYTKRAFSLKMVKGIWRAESIAGHKKRMKRDKAIKYYSDKLKEVWSEIL